MNLNSPGDLPTLLKDDISHFTDLNSAELEKVREINSAMAIFPNEYSAEYVGEVNSLPETMNSPGNYIKKYIKFCKQIAAYRCLSTEDQLVVFKKFYFEISAIRFSFLYDVSVEGFLCAEVCSIS